MSVLSEQEEDWLIFEAIRQRAWKTSTIEAVSLSYENGEKRRENDGSKAL
jgi:hypothetical protein